MRPTFLEVLAVATAAIVFGFSAPSGEAIEAHLAAICLPPTP